MKRMLPLIACILISTPVFADSNKPIEYNINKDKSSLGFEVTVNSAPLTAEFKNYDIKVLFSPDNLDASKVSLVIKLDDLVTSHDELKNNATATAWLYTREFPEAKFESTKFTKIDDTNFKIDGKLTIRDVTDDIVVNCKMPQFFKDDGQKIVDCESTISRLKFHVGQGEWQDTGTVKDEVKLVIHMDGN